MKKSAVIAIVVCVKIWCDLNNRLKKYSMIFKNIAKIIFRVEDHLKFENTTKVFGYLSYIYMIKKRVLAFQKNDLVKNRITISEQKIPGISKWGIRNKIISNSAAFFNKRSPSQNAELQSALSLSPIKKT